MSVSQREPPKLGVEAFAAGQRRVTDLEGQLAALQQDREGLGRENDTLRDMLVYLLRFVTSELDPEPAPWPDYFGEESHVRLASDLQQEVDMQSGRASDTAPHGEP